METSGNTLSISDVNLLNEFYFRLAKIEYQQMLSSKHSQETSLFSQMTFLWWSTPPPIDITSVIKLLKKIPLDHKRFDEAQFLLQECRVHFKESFQKIVGSEAAVVKLGLRKQE